jgi:surfactin synthase thioesterase subunit
MSPDIPTPAQPTLSIPVPRPRAPWRVYCLPPGGFGAEFYLPWCSFLPSSIELCGVRLPGRGSLADQPNLTNPRDLTAAVAEVIQKQGDARPFAIFGHCVGALMAFTTTLRLRRIHRRPPILLAVSALAAPHLGSYARAFGLRLASGHAAMSEVTGLPPEHLRQNPERLATAYVPLLADLLLALQYRHHKEPPWEGDLAIYGGEDDPLTTLEQLSAWNDLVATPTAVHLFPGGHMYLTQVTETVVHQLSNDLHSAACS